MTPERKTSTVGSLSDCPLPIANYVPLPVAGGERNDLRPLSPVDALVQRAEEQALDDWQCVRLAV
jgi:hypothetical protein